MSSTGLSAYGIIISQRSFRGDIIILIHKRENKAESFSHWPRCKHKAVWYLSHTLLPRKEIKISFEDILLKERPKLWEQIMALSLTRCEIWGTSFNLSEPTVPHL